MNEPMTDEKLARAEQLASSYDSQQYIRVMSVNSEQATALFKETGELMHAMYDEIVRLRKVGNVYGITGSQLREIRRRVPRLRAEGYSGTIPSPPEYDVLEKYCKELIEGVDHLLEVNRVLRVMMEIGLNTKRSKP